MFRIIAKDYNGVFINITAGYNKLEDAYGAMCVIKSQHHIEGDDIKIIESPALDTKEICHTAPNSRVTQGAEAHIAEAATS